MRNQSLFLALPFLGAGHANVVGTRRVPSLKPRLSAPRNGRAVFLCALTAIAACWLMSGRTRAESDEPVPKYTLRYRFQPGETIRWQVSHRNRVRTTGAGVTQTAESTSESVKVWRVSEVTPDGAATFVYSVEQVQMRQLLSGREEQRFDSESDSETPAGFEQVASAVGRPLSTVTLSDRGTVLKRERELPTGPTENEGDITIPLPEEPVAVGERWSRPHEVQVRTDEGGVKTIRTRQTFTLDSVRHGVAFIRVRTAVLTPVRDPAIEAQLTQCAAKGEVRFDIDAGRVLRQHMETDKRVVGFRGEATSLHYQTRFAEELLPNTVRTARAK